MAIFNNNQLRALFAWLCLFLVIHYLYKKSPSLESVAETQVTKVKPHGFDAVVYIALGSVTTDPMVDLSVESVRKVGKYSGSIYVVTDRPTCFADLVSKFDVTLITTTPRDSIIKIKALKPDIFSFLPAHIEDVLYIDIDILVTRELSSFIRDSTASVATIKSIAAIAPVVKKHDGNSSIERDQFHYDLGAFFDAKGHYVGFCSGCEKWHTGILLMHRSHGRECLKAWKEILLSGKYDTDQESLDEAERVGKCKYIINFPPRHLLFAKDYIGWILTSGHTFVHLTAAARIDTQVSIITFCAPDMFSCELN